MKHRHIIPKPVPIRRMREPFATITDRVMERDREWFDAHPGATSYERDYVPGEVDPAALKEMYGDGTIDQDCRVLVTRLGPGMRTRALIRGMVTYSGSAGNG